MKRYASELVGTFALVFAGTGAESPGVPGRPILGPHDRGDPYAMTESGDRITARLFAEAKEGNRAAFDELIVRFQGRLLVRIRMMMGEKARNMADSDDFLNGVVADVVRDFDRARIRDEKHFVCWATEVARNNIRDAVRKRGEEAFASFSTVFVDPPTERAPKSPSEIARAVEEQHALAEALESLQEDLRRVIELRNFSELSFGEIGEKMNRSENAAQLLHKRAMVQLGGLLDV